MANKGILYIFDLHNIQEQYAKCLEFISILLGQESSMKAGQELDRVKTISQEIKISGMHVPDGSKNYYEQQIEMTDGSVAQNVLNARRIDAKNIRSTILGQEPLLLHFHIRVHLHEDREKQIQSLPNLQYLALLLRRLDSIYSNILKLNHVVANKGDGLKQISVFIVPSSDDYYPFQDAEGSVDYDTFKVVSQYLRLLSKENTGVIYGVVERRGAARVRALDFRNSKRFTDFFPLIPLNEKTYDKLYNEPVTEDFIDSLFKIKGNKRFQAANDQDPYKALTDFIAESALYQLTNMLENWAKESKNAIWELIEEELRRQQTQGKLWLLTLALFLFTFQLSKDYENLKREEITSLVCQNLDFAAELSAGLRQIAQNTLQHSYSHEGFFSFYLNRYEENKATLRIILSDFNDYQSFIDNFASNLRREAEYTYNAKLKDSYLNLIEHKDIISLGYFFGEYDGGIPGEVWINFRRADTSAHIGLLIFSLVLRHCKGALNLMNSTEYSVSQQQFFTRSYAQASDASIIDSIENPGFVIPGTQLVLTIPVGIIENKRPRGLGQLSSMQSIQENYNAFAQYLDYTPKEIEFSIADYKAIVEDEREGKIEALNALPMADAVMKAAIIRRWERYWLCHTSLPDRIVINEETVYYINIGRLPVELLETPDDIEAFIKGLINSLDSLCNGRELLLALINVSALFLQVFRQITISLSPKQFPSGLQLYVAESGIKESIHLVGASFDQAITNAYTLSLEHGSQSYSFGEVERSHMLFQMVEGKLKQEEKTEKKGLVCPFDAILPDPNNSVQSLFDEWICRLADGPIDEGASGYTLTDIHMRLGSKVHIRSFYEMAFLFYRSGVSNRVAFEILRHINHSKSPDAIDLEEDNILFYGYASYSKALLTSILEILKAYRRGKLEKRCLEVMSEKERSMLKQKIDQVSERLALASYQHNLQSENKTEMTELYFDFYNSKIGQVLDNNKASFCAPVKIVQIVPISSTLTTFDKMQLRLNRAIEYKEDMKEISASAKYTVFWVTDKMAKRPDQPRKETEGKYWIHVDTESRCISLNPETMQNLTPITYFMRAPVVWEDPLQCALCYPDNVIDEVPLVETDQTSTVPALQLRGNKSVRMPIIKEHEENDERLLKLRSCVSYGHVQREKNHFQFYIDTQSYFYSVNEEVKLWLERLKDKRNKAEAMLNIIFSPEHTTNVGFAQYVNNYYFDGNAEIVCINEDKEFRSNFVCEHMALINTIDELLSRAEDDKRLPVSFYFADDTITSGETFHKAVSFLHSLIPARYRNLYPANLIEKCFLLVDRLSVESKQIYVKSVENDFMSFLHIDVSNMRTQGDSCVACKLKQNANKLFKRSSTYNIAKFWEGKTNRYAVQGYNIALSACDDEKERAFRKLVLAHITQNVLFHDNEHFRLGSIFDSIMAILAEIIGERTHLECNFNYMNLMKGIEKCNKIELLQDFLKLISRPFFSFDFKVKLQVLTLLLIISEFLIDEESFNAKSIENRDDLFNNPYKSFMFKKGRISETFRLLGVLKRKYLNTHESQICFIQDCIIDNLVELRSTYLMRKATIKKMYQFLQVSTEGVKEEHSRASAFWGDYVAGVHQILDCNSDETRSLWLEYLLISGEECKDFINSHNRNMIHKNFVPHDLCHALVPDAKAGGAFEHFCDELFMQNSRVLFDGIENSVECHASENAYSLEYWRRCRSLDGCVSEGFYDGPADEEKELFKALRDPKTNGDIYQVKLRYDKLLEQIVKVAEMKYGFKRTDIALITSLKQKHANEDRSIEISQLDFVSCILASTIDSYFNKYEIKNKLKNVLETQTALKEYGYVMSERSNNSGPFFFVYFRGMAGDIVPVYLYFSYSDAKSENEDLRLRLFLRDLLSYHNRIVRTLKNDFAGDIFSKYAHTSGEKSILAHEKATSHNSTGDDNVTLEVFMDQKSFTKYDVLDSDSVMKWLLLRNYTNAQIAKLFNRNYRLHKEYDNDANFPTPPPMYLKNVDGKRMNSLSWFERPLRRFSDLRILDDGRFMLLDNAVSIDYDKIRHEKFLMNDQNEYYNVEYIKSILIDIIITAMKYGTSSATYLERVDKYLKGRNRMQHSYLLTEEEQIRLKQGECCIKCEVEVNEKEPFNYLVIYNDVDMFAHNLFDWKMHNQIIRARLENPIDYADGHMSLLAISQYIEGLWPEKLHKKTKFQYIECDSKLCFKTQLPIIGKENL